MLDVPTQPGYWAGSSIRMRRMPSSSKTPLDTSLKLTMLAPSWYISVALALPEIPWYPPMSLWWPRDAV